MTISQEGIIQLDVKNIKLIVFVAVVVSNYVSLYLQFLTAIVFRT